MSDPITRVCRLDYYPASRSSGKRHEAMVKWIVLHDEEAGTARSAASWFHDKRDPADGGPAGSAHLCVDDDVCYRCLGNDAIPWGAASAIDANLKGFHVEMAGFARWSAAIWFRHARTLRRAAYKTALHCQRFDIPVRWVSAADLPYKAGITSHAEISKASKRIAPLRAYEFSHYDPGPFFPRRIFMKLVRSYYEKL